MPVSAQRPALSAAAQSGSLVIVPQTTYRPRVVSPDADSLGEFPAISFNLASRDGKSATRGVPLAYIASQSELPNPNAALAALICNAEDKVFQGVSRAYLRIIWPGYEHVEFVTSIPLHQIAGRTTRAQVAQFVLKATKQYFTTLSSAHCLPSKKVWAVAPAGQWRTEDLVLVKLSYVHGNTFQPEFAVRG